MSVERERITVDSEGRVYLYDMPEYPFRFLLMLADFHFANMVGGSNVDTVTSDYATTVRRIIREFTHALENGGGVVHADAALHTKVVERTTYVSVLRLDLLLFRLLMSAAREASMDPEHNVAYATEESRNMMMGFWNWQDHVRNVRESVCVCVSVTLRNEWNTTGFRSARNFYKEIFSMHLEAQPLIP